MKTKKTVWIPAMIAAVVAALLVTYYVYTSSVQGGAHGLPPGGRGRPPGGEGREEGGEMFTTLGTIAVFLGAATFSWFWFKKKLKSPSMLVRKAGKILYSVHKLLGSATLILIVVHGIYFLITKLHDHKIYTGLASFVILLAIVGYGFFINKVRNKWMRTVHRSLGLIWVPVLLLHAGGSAIMAAISCVAVGGLVWILERSAGQAAKPIPGDR
ncbi:hypothetical protein PASE110613_07260 [Paenibacillus sediminis]|uniref:Ferric oxidoreductase domain-containing protein n=1 Tax=Paenibacillus sediminis TaxID=664909 RepID=A0ABS4H426_9BACL|nr:hypothetical protein [Paenibacillus sediminis]MBP1936865.1 hypothetical protein [Paenibacillus sediminis]